MKSYIHEFRTWGPVSRCRIHIKEVKNQTWIAFENLGDGTSVTNASEQLAKEIISKEGLDPENCRFFEWYSEYDGDLAEITYNWSADKEARHPDWRYFCGAEENPFTE